jgi:4-oxalocrotonate tautomerase family enzyme
MPLVKIEIIKGKTAEYKKQLLNAVHTGLINSIHISDDDRFQRLYELDEECFERSPQKTNQFTMIEITMFHGRTKEQKQSMIETITKQLQETLGLIPTDVFIVINDPLDENWGFAGKQRG